MTLRVARLARIDLTVADLARAARFYVEALGFSAGCAHPLEPAAAKLLGVERGEEIEVHRGSQVVRLQRLNPPGAPYPAGCTAADLVFQHFAVVTQEIGAAYAQLCALGPAAISNGGPQLLPPESGGATAFKFRDPDGHPLELIQFADRRAGGIDHTAIAVADVARSIAYYSDRFGFNLQTRQVNAGLAQDALDGLNNVHVDVAALTPTQDTPHLELLGYHPAGRAHPPLHPADIAASRTVFEVQTLPRSATGLADGGTAALVQDPDGHLVVLIEAAKHVRQGGIASPA